MSPVEPRILFVTPLYSKQKYAQEERIEAFNAANEECQKHGLSMLVMTVVNNSPKSFAPWLERLHKSKARFPYLVKDIGEKNYRAEMDSDAKAISINPQTGEIRPVEEFDAFRSAGKTKIEYFDIFRLMAEIHNSALDYAADNGFDYFSFVSGDQIIPKEFPIVLIEFLKHHPECGLVTGLVYFTGSKETKMVDGVKRESYRPMVRFENYEHTKWLHANMLPTREHGGMEFVEIDYCGVGGGMVPRSVIANRELRFPDKLTDVGEDLAFCRLLREKGKKVFLIPWLKIPNRYPNGELY